MAGPSGIAFEEKTRGQCEVIERAIGGGGQKDRIDGGDEAFKQNDVLTGDGGQRIVAGQRHASDVAVPWHDVVK